MRRNVIWSNRKKIADKESLHVQQSNNCYQVPTDRCKRHDRNVTLRHIVVRLIICLWHFSETWPEHSISIGISRDIRVRKSYLGFIQSPYALPIQNELFRIGFHSRINMNRLSQPSKLQMLMWLNSVPSSFQSGKLRKEQVSCGCFVICSFCSIIIINDVIEVQFQWSE